MNELLKLVHLFSRFPRFDDTGKRNRLIWRSHSALHRNMWRFLDSQNNLSEDGCARYFLQLLQNAIAPKYPEDLAYARKHLTAYLCVTSYIVAKRLHQGYQKIEFFQHRYDERDYLQMAIQYANNPQQLLAGFDFQRQHKDGKLYFVKTFAKAVLERKVKDELYKYNKESILGKYKDWGLLRYDTTRKELKIALQSQIEEAQIEQYLFVWNCFKEICKPSQKRSDPASPPPNYRELKDLARLYQNCYAPPVPVTTQQIEQMLQVCITVMQNHRNLKLYYPDAMLTLESDRDRWDEFFIHANEWGEGDLLNSIARAEERKEISTLVRASWETLSSENQTMLFSSDRDRLELYESRLNSPQTIHLSQWFQDRFEMDWQSLENIVKNVIETVNNANSKPVYAFRTKETNNRADIPAIVDLLKTNATQTIRWHATDLLGEMAQGNTDAIAALIDIIQQETDPDLRRQAAVTLKKIDPQNILGGIRRAKLINLGVQFESDPVVLIVTLIPDRNDKVQVHFRISPLNLQDDLPANLSLEILDEADRVFDRVVSRQSDNFIQCGLKCDREDTFTVRVTLGDLSVQEQFIV
ncbi:MAG: DUF1822 family protein [Spirulina sp.]